MFQDNGGHPPDPEVAVRYAEAIGNPAHAVLADTEVAILDTTPWPGDTLPGKCVLSPQMELLDCYSGDEDERAFEAILAHWSAR